jgi:hypothetical protein
MGEKTGLVRSNNKIKEALDSFTPRRANVWLERIKKQRQEVFRGNSVSLKKPLNLALV